MSSSRNIRAEYDQTPQHHIPLIHSLSDDLAILCLSRVPRKYHHVLRCVSKSWRALLCSEDWLSCRSRQNLTETWIYAMCVSKDRVNCCYVLDPNALSLNWKLLGPIPPQCIRREGMSFEALGRKLFLFGGCSCHEKATDEVYCYDACAGKWEEVARMPTGRCYFLSAALGDKIYVTGGLGLSSVALSCWDIYDCRLNEWSSHQDPSLIPDIVKSFAFEGKVYTVHSTWVDRQYARAYDPSSRSWEDLSRQMTSCCHGPTVVSSGILHMLDETHGTRLMTWEKENEEWVLLGRLAQGLTNPPCQLVAVGSCVYVVGHNLSTVVVDTEINGARPEGVLVGSSLAPKLGSDVSVMSCKAVTI
ncbi:putative F-box/kelch-repeat protein [Platanthera guangdongensis]|uniref:F-box/kelch-repeat protein n=1 Tax=Platanthera guangdongensis TaxID=2320717 RepID=A0ABR2MTK8_9ASPA